MKEFTFPAGRKSIERQAPPSPPVTDSVDKGWGDGAKERRRDWAKEKERGKRKQYKISQRSDVSNLNSPPGRG